ncbi:hypothetical protein ABC766_27085 [Methylobacterium fujisawaense]|uniref:hypothetical protein n=1 Tax=Methylobacterium fujisawaense TaxID=107400 RepID=UPI0031F52900
MEQARPDSTVLPAAQIDAGHGCDGSHDRDERITQLLTARPTAPLPEPGSAEAKEAWRAACHEHTIRTQFANEYPELKRTPLEWWTFDTISKALETGELTPAECARLYPLATERELLMAQIEHELNLAGLFALAYAEHYPVAISDADPDATEEETGSDADLLSLGRRFEDASARETAANEACNAAEASQPHGEPIPKALDDAANDAGDEAAALADRIAALPAHTAAGFRVKLRALAHYSRGVLLPAIEGDLPDPNQLLAHSLWRDVQGESGNEAPAVPIISDAKPDPVLAAIAASRRAEAEMEATEAAFGGRRMTDAEQAREDAAERDQKDTRAAVWATVPTTAEGRAALAQYAAFQAERTFGPDWRAKMEQEFCGDALLALIAAIEAEGAAGAGPDGALVELAAEFCRAYRRHGEIDRAMMAGTVTEEAWKPHHEAITTLADKLAATTPTTMIGMALKCLGPIGLLAWQVSENDDAARLAPHERMAAEFEAAILGGTLTPILSDPSSRNSLTADRAWAVAQAAPIDLSVLTVGQLHCLYECFADASDQWGALTHKPWANEAPVTYFRTPTFAGRIIEREQERAAEIRSRIAEEIRGRKPLTEDEHDWRLETLIHYEILCEGSLRHAPELRAEIATAWGA